MQLAIGLQKIILTPIGTMLIGMRGRVDMIGARGMVRMILADRDSTGSKITTRISIDCGKLFDGEKPELREINWVWKIIQESPVRGFIDLTGESLMKSILAISNY
jgi:hypothetical protein